MKRKHSFRVTVDMQEMGEMGTEYMKLWHLFIRTFTPNKKNKQLT